MTTAVISEQQSAVTDSIAGNPTGGMSRRQSALRAARIAVTVVTAAAMGLILGLLLAAYVATRLFGFHILTLQTDSMAPTLQRGDVIVVRPVQIDQVESGEIIAFESGGDRIKIVHRVVGVIVMLSEYTDPVTQEAATSAIYRLHTRGDSAEFPDRHTVEASNLLGSFWFSIPRIGIGPGGIPLQSTLLAIAALTLVAWIASELRTRMYSPKKRSNPSSYSG